MPRTGFQVEDPRRNEGSPSSTPANSNLNRVNSDLNNIGSDLNNGNSDLNSVNPVLNNVNLTLSSQGNTPNREAMRYLNPFHMFPTLVTLTKHLNRCNSQGLWVTGFSNEPNFYQKNILALCFTVSTMC